MGSFWYIDDASLEPIRNRRRPTLSICNVGPYVFHSNGWYHESDDLHIEYQTQRSDLALPVSLSEDPGRNFSRKHLASSVIHLLRPFEQQQGCAWLDVTFSEQYVSGELTHTCPIFEPSLNKIYYFFHHIGKFIDGAAQCVWLPDFLDPVELPSQDNHTLYKVFHGFMRFFLSFKMLGAR